MNTDTHSQTPPTPHPTLLFPQSTIRKTQMLASLTHRVEGQTELGGGVSRRDNSKGWGWGC